MWHRVFCTTKVHGLFVHWTSAQNSPPFSPLPLESSLAPCLLLQFSSVAQLCPTVCDPIDCNQAFLSITNSRSLLRLISLKSVMPSILSHPLLLPLSIFPSIRVFSSESVLCIRWPKYLEFQTYPSNEYSGLISFRIDWFDLLAVQGTQKRLFHHHSLKASVLQHSAFFIVQLSHSHRTTGKTIALTI